ncbi:killer cell lectin-like receptor subfamily F member 1 isoform X2 [Eptesicus fuscus]|uniref:killer cell lectin-like receptor subfamily F member 1 isoform X2 n=1 Tax=Eptesicus fuscus TaxID=29078 RepID=UPI002404553C|nr:killer cell lectin-like receptor subfamily F member 1 isoform X2 [Eptesicus fuscus]
MSLFPSNSKMDYSIYRMFGQEQNTERSTIQKPRKHPYHCQHKWTCKVCHPNLRSFSDNHNMEMFVSENGTRECNCINTFPRKQPSNTNFTRSPTLNLCPNDWVQEKGKCYNFFKIFNSWTDSQQFCLRMKSQLLMIQDKAELAFIQNSIQDGIYFWIGLNITYPRKTWTWLDGTPLSPQLCEVKSKDEDNACAVITKKGVFSETCQTHNYHICQNVISSDDDL